MMKEKMNNRQMKGITLIALVITIIVLLILAGITVAQLSGNNLFENAKLAKEKYQQARDQEDEIIGDYEDAITGDRGSKFNYSTEEQVIGTWINGKPLYQKTFAFDQTLSIPANSWTDSGKNLDNVGVITSANTFGNNYGVYSSIQASTNGTVGIAKNHIALFAIQYGLNIDYLTIQYTKTID